MKKNKNVINKILCLIILVFTITVVAPINNIAMANDGTTNEEEIELNTMIEEYSDSNLQVKNGLSIDVGQTIQYKSLLHEEETSIPFELVTQDENIVAINENKEFVGIAPGETYITLQSDAGTYLYQVQVTSPSENSNNFNLQSGNTMDNNTSKYKLSPLSYGSSTLARNTNYRVFIDAGHGGTDPGATGNGLKEKDLNLSIALKVQRILQAQGIEVVMSRTTDKFLQLSQISSLANNSGSDAFASIHINSAVTTAAYGIETFYYPNRMDSKPLADSTQGQVISSTGAYNRGVKTADYHVIRETTMPSVLVECGFISNASEATRMKTNSYQELLASGISNGITKYLEANIVLDSIPAQRISGVTRYATSYAVARSGWSSADTVVIAPGNDYPDALCAGPLATKYNAPILLADNTSLSKQTELKALLSSLNVKNVFIVGGTGVISASFENEVKSMGIATERFGGINRYETSVKIAEKVGNNGEFVVATGEGFADSLSISSVAAKKGMPILLTSSDGLSDYAKSYLSKQTVNKTYVVGGTGVVSNQIMQQLRNAERLGGIDRYVTNEVIFNRFKGEINTNEMYMALGTNFPDALSVSALAGKNSYFVLLSREDTMTQSIKNILSQYRSNINKFFILGGPTLISDSLLRSVRISIK